MFTYRQLKKIEKIIKQHQANEVLLSIFDNDDLEEILYIINKELLKEPVK